MGRECNTTNKAHVSLEEGKIRAFSTSVVPICQLNFGDPFFLYFLSYLHLLFCLHGTAVTVGQFSSFGWFLRPSFRFIFHYIICMAHYSSVSLVCAEGMRLMQLSSQVGNWMINANRIVVQWSSLLFWSWAELCLPLQKGHWKWNIGISLFLVLLNIRSQS